MHAGTFFNTASVTIAHHVPADHTSAEFVRLQHSNGSEAQIYLWGACITSYKDANGVEYLGQERNAVFDQSEPIAGGMPICFPQFGTGGPLIMVSSCKTNKGDVQHVDS